MPKDIDQNQSLLEILADSKLDHRIKKSILNYGPDTLITCLCCCCLNLIKGNLPLNQSQLKKLKRHRKWIRNVADTSSTVSKKRKFLTNKGGGGGASKRALDIALPLILNLVLEHFHGRKFDDREEY